VALHQLLTALKNLSFIYNVVVNQLLIDFKKAYDAVGRFLKYFQLIYCSQGISYVKKLLEKMGCFITVTFQTCFRIRHYEGSSKPGAITF
jgi:hypothetical protein